MSTWLDIIALIVTISVLGGVVYGVIYGMNAVNESMSSTKEQLKSRGLDVSASGVSVKTSKRFDRSDYVDATQRNLIKAMGAASFRKGEAGVAPPIDRQTSNTSIKSTSSDGKKKMKGLFGTRKENKSS